MLASTAAAGLGNRRTCWARATGVTAPAWLRTVGAPVTARLQISPSGRATCRTCETRIGAGELRVAEPSVQFDQTTERFHHLACFVDDNPNAAITAILAATPALRTAAEAALSGNAAFLHAVTKAAADTAAARAASGDELDAETDALLAQLAENPRNGALLSVLQDHLQERGHPRGDLIALELARGPDTARLVELKRRLWPAVKDVRVTWGTGFLRTMSVTIREPASMGAAGEALSHPSARLLEELTLERWTGPLPTAPASLQRLELRTCRGVGPSVGALARVRHLELSHVDDANAIQSTSLTSLGLGSGLAAVPLAGAVPLVHTLVVSAVDSLPRLAAAGLLQQATVLVFPDAWDGAALDVLAATGATWNQLLFPRLQPTDEHRRVLTRLSPCAAVMHLEGEVQTLLHDSRPEWGLGRVRSTTNTSLEVAFSSVVRTFSRDVRVSPVDVLEANSA